MARRHCSRRIRAKWRFGLDYWIAPSIVWQNEFDIELPRAGGYFIDGSGETTPAGSIPNDKAFLSQFTVGF